MTQPSILLVNDIPDHAALYERTLQQRGFRVHLVRSAADALGVLATERPVCIVIDVRLPDRDGWDLCRAIKAMKALTATPIVMLTEDVSQARAAEAVRAGCSAWIAHPINTHDLVRTIDHVLKERRPEPVEGKALVGQKACGACGSDQVRAGLRLGTIQYYRCLACRLFWRVESAESVA